MFSSLCVPFKRRCFRLVHLCTLLISVLLVILLVVWWVCLRGDSRRVTSVSSEAFRVGTCPVPSHPSAKDMQCNLLPNLINELNVHNHARGGNRPSLAVSYPAQCLDCQPIIRSNGSHNLSPATHKHLSKSYAQSANIRSRQHQQTKKLAATSVDQSRAVNALTGKYPSNPTKYQLQQEVHTVDSDIARIKQRLRKLERFERT